MPATRAPALVAVHQHVIFLDDGIGGQIRQGTTGLGLRHADGYGGVAANHFG